MWHALGAWLIYNSINSEFELDEFKTFYEIIEGAFTYLQDLIVSVADVTDITGAVRFLGLNSWKFTQYGSWTFLPAFIFYIEKGTKLIPSQIPESGTPIKPHPSMERIVRFTKGAIDFIKQDKDRWVGKIISNDSWNKVDEFLELNKRALV